MKITWKLALAYAWHHPARMLLTSLAMIASACVVVWVVSGYDALMSQNSDHAFEYLGRYDFFVVPDSRQEPSIAPSVLNALQEDQTVAEIEPVLQTAIRIQPETPKRGEGREERGEGTMKNPSQKGNGPRRPMFMSSPILVGTNAKEPPYAMAEGRWIRHDDPKLREAVLSNLTAEQLKVHLGDEVLAIFGTKEFRLKIVGITTQTTAQPLVQKPEASSTGRPIMRKPGGTPIGPAASALYVPMELSEKITRQPNKINLINVKLHKDADVKEFYQRWMTQLSKAKPPVLLIGVNDLKTAMEEGMMAQNARNQAWAATGMSLLAALFIIFTTLSMGVHERVRQFAVMRAVGLTRGQIARIIGVESILLALIGWGGGLVAGWGLLSIVSHAKPTLFVGGASLGGWCILLTGISALGGALAASIFPAWQATRVDPLEAMSPRRSIRPSMKMAVSTGMIGLILIAINPLLLYVAPIPDAARYGIHAALGYSCMALGFLMLTPLAIIVVEAVVGPLLARFAMIEPRLLASQLRSNLWRTLGATVALSVGLGLYASMLVWGYSMLQPFKPGEWVPDVLAAFQMGGLPDAEIAAIRNVQGVIPEQCIPLAVEQPRLAGDITDSEHGNSVTRQDNVIMIGLDPQVAFGGPHPMIHAEFVEGSPESAVAKLKQGRFCIVPDHFLAATGLHVGDHFSMLPPVDAASRRVDQHMGPRPNTTTGQRGETPRLPQSVEYTIAGVVSLPGWHWMTKFSGLRRRDGRSAAMIFANYDDVRRDFDLRQINFVWMNIDKKVGVDKIAEGIRPIADRNLGEKQPVNGQGTWSVGATMLGQSLRISTPDDVRTRITSRADDMIWAMCELPLITLLVTSLGVVNTVAASVRARRWEFGVMRAVGVTRWTMTRMILVEGLLIGVIACALSLAFGVMAGWCGVGISQYVSFFGGMATPLVIPWAKLAFGFSITLALCLAAALWPAISTGRAEPLTLLQAGRTAM
jgi:putative ABC transport system permease protein